MENLSEILQARATDSLKKILKSDAPLAEIVQSTHPQFGHYQCNSAMELAKKTSRHPREIAEQIVKNWGLDERVEKLEVAGPGFVNITLKKEFLDQELNRLATDRRLGASPLKKRKKIIVEFSSPNIAKELHVGHLRSTIIGESLARLFEFLGHQVLRLNHIGDWGTQFGMLIAYLKEFQKEVLSGEKKADLPALMDWYRESKKLFDTNPAFKKRAQIEVVNLQKKEKEALAVWETIREISRKGFQEIYDWLDVSLIERGESYYNETLPKVIEEYEAKGIIQISDGAKCVFLEGFKGKDQAPLPLILQKSDGGYNYATTDTAALFQRIHIEKGDRILYVVDAGQRLHFQMVFAAAFKAGYYDPARVEIEHVPFGVVLGADGKKFKTRSGQTEKLIDLLKEAVYRAKILLKNRLPSVEEKDLEKLAKILGINSVKYADLSCHRLKDYIFNYDRMLNFEGNTAAYLLYSYVRIQGIKEKCNRNIDLLSHSARIQLTHPTEIALGLKLRQFGEALTLMDRDLLPNRLSDYLYHLAEKFHAFFRDCRVKGSPQEDSRLLLCELTSQILQKGLYILGLKTMDRM
uniref:Arginine--tRNA ligase n=1 Tax=Candidatus Fritschea bemisiae TaxID=206681 RepID=Q7X398_9BACT|nr:argynyl tRNA synthetase [Candidatus Fritschea bemisiae]